jgi:hypothetical protein
MKLYVEALCYKLGKDLVVVPWAVALERSRSIVPIAHEEPDDLMTLLLKQVCCHRRIDTARKTNDYAHS